ncbi:hypothetical protein [Herbaspirillum huttiense]|uniref:hypothetical protein n=1 Tax=Herbaspirillum huttiense TaxID=863372 RepID=UPI002176BBA3|nr:hypothetical protein [Herbaspirillum huttiense]UWE19378.1 hypothetical protein NY669_26750 [Herbaspirillum huttiense]
MSSSIQPAAKAAQSSQLQLQRQRFEERWPIATECRAGGGYHGAFGLRWEGWLAALDPNFGS